MMIYGFELPGSRMRWMKLNGDLAPIRSTLCLSGTGVWSFLSHCTISWHSGIHRPGSNSSASFLEIWEIVFLLSLMVLYVGSCKLHSQWGERMVLFSSPPLSLIHQQECSEWFHCHHIWSAGWRPSWQRCHSALSQPAVEGHVGSTKCDSWSSNHKLNDYCICTIFFASRSCVITK